VLTGGFEVKAQGGPSRLRRVELSVVWVTGASGRGSCKTELGACHFEEYEADGDDDSALFGTRQFRVILPDGPPSFSGQLFQVTWAVRVRFCYRDGKESVRDLPFLLLSSCGEQIVGDAAEVGAAPEFEPIREKGQTPCA
jgi:hypothetical protein